jgi:hypothetical protein
MSLGFGEGGESQAPLGRAVIGGLTTSTFITLFLVPVCYMLFFRKSERLKAIEKAAIEKGSEPLSPEPKLTGHVLPEARLEANPEKI